MASSAVMDNTQDQKPSAPPYHPAPDFEREEAANATKRSEYLHAERRHIRVLAVLRCKRRANTAAIEAVENAATAGRTLLPADRSRLDKLKQHKAELCALFSKVRRRIGALQEQQAQLLEGLTQREEEAFDDDIDVEDLNADADAFIADLFPSKKHLCLVHGGALNDRIERDRERIEAAEDVQIETLLRLYGDEDQVAPS